MSDRIQKSWKVLQSIENKTGDFCVDVFVREDGSFGFEEFRKDPEDRGKWTAISYYSAHEFTTENEALNEARLRIGWLEDL